MIYKVIFLTVPNVVGFWSENFFHSDEETIPCHMLECICSKLHKKFELIFSKSAKVAKSDQLARVHHNVCANNNAEESKAETNHFVHVGNPDYSELKDVGTDWQKSCSVFPEL